MSQAPVVGPGGGRLLQRPDSDNLWKEALDSLSEEDRSKIDIQAPSLQVLSELHELTKKEIERAKQGQFTFTRKNGQKVIVKDLFAKVAKWIDHFKQVGDIAVQYDPVHAALPWAGVRFLLEIAISDFKSGELIFEHSTSLAEIICRYAVFEALLLRQPSTAVSELKRAFLMLYKDILTYLAKAKGYFQDSSFSQLERHADLQKILEDIESPLARMENNIEELKDQLDVSKRTRVLQWISAEPYEKHHKLARADVLKGTGQWLLTDPVYIDWKNDSASSILWLHGIPGSGKTKLVSTVIEDAIEDHRKGLIPRPVYFYCSRNPAEPGRSRPRDIVASLLRQIARINPRGPLLEPVAKAYREEEERGFPQGSWELDKCCDLIIDLLPCHQMVTILIDALDECDPRLRDELLVTLEHILQNSPILVKIFVSSRDDQDIVCHLEGYPNVELSSERNSDDINSFIISETDRLIERRKLLRHSSDRDGLKSLIIAKLSEGANGMFRWVSLQLQALCDLKTDQAIRERAGKLPASLEELYQELLIKIEQFPARADRQYAHNTFSWLLSAQRTLKTEEFLVAVSKSIGQGPEVLTKEHVLSLCFNLVVFDPTLDTFRFAHLSVREYLEKQTKFGDEETHALAAEVCLLSLIGSTNTQDTWNFLKRWNFTAPDLESFKKLYSYAAIYWGVHCHEIRETRPNGNLEKLLSYFLPDEPNDKSPFCHWECELPETLRQLGDREISLSYKLRDCLGESPSPMLAACVFDLAHVLKSYGAEDLPRFRIRSRSGWTCFEITCRHESFACMDVLMDTNHDSLRESLLYQRTSGGRWSVPVVQSLRHLLKRNTISLEVTDYIVQSAAGDSRYGLELMKLLLDHAGHRLPLTETAICEAISNHRVGKEILDLFIAHLGGRFQPYVTERVIRHAVRRGDRKTVKTILSQADPSVCRIGDLLMHTALSQSGHTRGVMSLLLESSKPEDITEDVVVRSCQNSQDGKQILELLLSQKGVQFQATDRVLRAVVDNTRHGLDIINLFMAHEIKLHITKDIVQYALDKDRAGDAMLTYLLDQHSTGISVTEGTLITLANRGRLATVKLLLDHTQGPGQISERVMMAVAENTVSDVHLDKALDILLRSHEVEEGVLIAAATNPYDAGPTLIAALLQQRSSHFKATENMLIAAAENRLQGVAVIQFLLGQYQDSSSLTEKVFQTAASRNIVALMRILLEHSKNPSQITEKVILAAAANYSQGYGMTRLLLEQNAQVTAAEKIMLVAARNEGQGLQTMKLLEAQGMQVPITEDLLSAACGNGGQGFEILQWLFRRHGDNIPVTDHMLEIAARTKRCILSLLLDYRKSQEAISGNVLISAATHWSYESMALLVERCQDQICMTEDVILLILQAVKRPFTQVIPFLFGQYKDKIQVTSDILKSACRHGSKETVNLLLKIKPDRLRISHDMIAAAAENPYMAAEILTLLQERLVAEKQPMPVTAEVVEAAVRSPFSEEVLRFLIQNNKTQTGRSITETAIFSAACSGRRKALELFQTELGYNVNDEYLSIAALRNACEAGDSDSVRDLIRKGINPDLPDHKGQTPLFWAALKAKTEILDMLLQTGLVNVNRQNMTGRSPIFYAVVYRNHEMICSLLRAKAKVDISDRSGTTPESLARTKCFYGMFRYLMTRYG